MFKEFSPFHLFAIIFVCGVIVSIYGIAHSSFLFVIVGVMTATVTGAIWIFIWKILSEVFADVLDSFENYHHRP